MGSIHNTNSSVVNQTVVNHNHGGTRANDIEHIRQQLDALAERLQADMAVSRAEAWQAMTAVANLKAELAQPTPRLQTIEQGLSILGNLSSVAGWVGQIRPFLNNLL